MSGRKNDQDMGKGKAQKEQMPLMQKEDYDRNAKHPWGRQEKAAKRQPAVFNPIQPANSPLLLAASSASARSDVNDADVIAYTHALIQKLSSIEEINNAVTFRQSIQRKKLPISITDADNNNLFDISGNWVNAKECYVDSGNFDRIIGYLKDDLGLSADYIARLSDRDKIILEAICYDITNEKTLTETNRLTELASNDLKNAQQHFDELDHVKNKHDTIAKAAVQQLLPQVKHLINHTEPFARYLIENPVDLTEGINENLSDIDQYANASRVFNYLPQYPGIQHLLDSVEDAVRNDKNEDWGYLSLFSACHDMLDNDDNIKPSIKALLNNDGKLEAFYAKHGAEKINPQLIAAYHCMISSSFACVIVGNKFRPEGNDPSYDNTQSKAYLFSNRQIELCNTGVGKSINPASIKIIHERLNTIANDPKYPAKELQKAIKDLLYKNAVSRLEQAIDASNNTQIKNAAAVVLKEAKQAAIKSPENRPAITNAIQTAAAVVRNPDDPDSILLLQTKARKISQRSWGKILGGTMLVLAGTALVAGCTATALFSFGALAPVSILGFALGASMVAGGIAVGSGVVGLTAGAVGSTMFARGVTQGSKTKRLRKEMEDLAKQANKLHK